jgi:hypothetical protein
VRSPNHYPCQPLGVPHLPQARTPLVHATVRSAVPCAKALLHPTFLLCKHAYKQGDLLSKHPYRPPLSITGKAAATVPFFPSTAATMDRAPHRFPYSSCRSRRTNVSQGHCRSHRTCTFLAGVPPRRCSTAAKIPLLVSDPAGIFPFPSFGHYTLLMCPSYVGPPLSTYHPSPSSPVMRRPIDTGVR